MRINWVEYGWGTSVQVRMLELPGLLENCDNLCVIVNGCWELVASSELMEGGNSSANRSFPRDQIGEAILRLIFRARVDERHSGGLKNPLSHNARL